MRPRCRSHLAGMAAAVLLACGDPFARPGLNEAGSQSWLDRPKSTKSRLINGLLLWNSVDLAYWSGMPSVAEVVGQTSQIVLHA
jgi:hypothetical protein